MIGSFIIDQGNGVTTTLHVPMAEITTIQTSNIFLTGQNIGKLFIIRECNTINFLHITKLEN